MSKERETEMYLCGEKYERQYGGEYFFDSIFKVFGLKKLKDGHSGDLSDYLYWMVIGIVFVMSLLVVFV